MKNYGQIKKKIRYNQKEVKLSRFILNLSEEAKKWKKLSKTLRKKVNVMKV